MLILTGPEQKERDDTRASSQEVESLFPPFPYLPNYYAKKLDYYAKQGIQVNVVLFCFFILPPGRGWQWASSVLTHSQWVDKDQRAVKGELEADGRQV